jgi:hypothetical protein
MLCLAGVPCRWLHLGVVIQRSSARAVTSIDFTCCSMAYVGLECSRFSCGVSFQASLAAVLQSSTRQKRALSTRSPIDQPRSVPLQFSKTLITCTSASSLTPSRAWSKTTIVAEACDGSASKIAHPSPWPRRLYTIETSIKTRLSGP